MSSKNILLIGPHKNVRGGINSVQDWLIKNVSSQELEFIHIASTCNGTKFQKMTVFLASLIQIVLHVFKSKVFSTHVNLASGTSFMRKSIYINILFMLRVPILIHIHGGGFIDYYLGQSRIVKKYIRFIMNRSKYCVVLSSGWLDLLELHSIVESTRVKVIPNTVEPIKHLDVTDRKQQLGLLYMGRLVKNKGIEDIITVASKLKSRGINVRFNLCGSGEMDYFKNICRENNVSDMFVFHGWVSDSEKTQQYNSNDIFILPSYKEAMPMSILEAMSNSMFIISTRVGSIPEMLEKENCGVVVEPGDIDKIVRLVESVYFEKIDIEEYGRAAKVHFKKAYSPDVIRKMWQSIYSKM